jgi:hypothetical protein
MKKYLIYTLLLVLMIFPTYAANLEVVCDNNVDGDQCNIVSGTPLFNEDNWYPGGTLIKTIRVTNNDQNDDCKLKMYTEKETQSPSNFAQQVFTAITTGTDTIFGSVNETVASSTNNLQNIFDSSNISLGSIQQNGNTKEYLWYVTFNPEAGNEFQGANLSFDFNLQFTCNHDESSNSNNDNTDNQNNNEGEVQGTQTGNSLFSFLGSVLGDKNEETLQQEENQQPEVQGTATEVVTQTATVCKDYPFWGLLFVAQFILLLLISALLKNKKFVKNILKLLVAILFTYIFSTYICAKWDLPVSIVISILSFLI